MRLHRAFTALAALAVLGACEENAVQDITGPAEGARIRFFNFALNAPQVHFFSGDQKITASSSTSCQSAKNPPVSATDSLCHLTGIESAAGIAYGGASGGGSYTGVEPGQHALNARIAGGADKGLTIASASATIADGKTYSYFVSGLYNTATKSADAFVLEDDLPAAFDWTSTYVRFVNASHNAPAITLRLTDIETNQTIEVGSQVAYKSGSGFVKIPPAGYSAVLRLPDRDIVVANALGFQEGRAYTVSLRGDITVTSTTAATRPMLEVWLNR